VVASGESVDAIGDSESAKLTGLPGDWTIPVATATPVAAAARPVRVTVPRRALRAVRLFSPAWRGPERARGCVGTGAARCLGTYCS
jgi:hypothetical protein